MVFATIKPNVPNLRMAHMHLLFDSCEVFIILATLVSRVMHYVLFPMHVVMPRDT